MSSEYTLCRFGAPLPSEGLPFVLWICSRWFESNTLSPSTLSDTAFVDVAKEAVDALRIHCDKTVHRRRLLVDVTSANHVIDRKVDILNAFKVAASESLKTAAEGERHSRLFWRARAADNSDEDEKEGIAHQNVENRLSHLHVKRTQPKMKVKHNVIVSACLIAMGGGDAREGFSIRAKDLPPHLENALRPAGTPSPDLLCVMIPIHYSDADDTGKAADISSLLDGDVERAFEEAAQRANLQEYVCLRNVVTRVEKNRSMAFLILVRSVTLHSEDGNDAGSNEKKQSASSSKKTTKDNARVALSGRASSRFPVYHPMWFEAIRAFSSPPFSNGRDNLYEVVKARLRGRFGIDGAVKSNFKCVLKSIAIVVPLFVRGSRRSRRAPTLSLDACHPKWSFAFELFSRRPYSNGEDRQYDVVKSEIRRRWGGDAFDAQGKLTLKALAVAAPYIRHFQSLQEMDQMASQDRNTPRFAIAREENGVRLNVRWREHEFTISFDSFASGRFDVQKESERVQESTIEVVACGDAHVRCAAHMSVEEARYRALEARVMDVRRAARLSMEAVDMLRAASKLMKSSSLISTSRVGDERAEATDSGAVIDNLSIANASSSAERAYNDLRKGLDDAHSNASGSLRRAISRDVARSRTIGGDAKTWKLCRNVFVDEDVEEGEVCEGIFWRAKRASPELLVETKMLCCVSTPSTRAAAKSQDDASGEGVPDVPSTRSAAAAFVTTVLSVRQVLLSKVRTDAMRLKLGERLTPVTPRSARWSVASFESDGTTNVEAASTGGVVSALFLRYLRELPEPLVPLACHRDVWRAIAKSNEKDRVLALRDVLRNRSYFPAENFNVLRHVVGLGSRLVGVASTEANAVRILRSMGTAAFRFDPKTFTSRDPASKRVYMSLFAEYESFVQSASIDAGVAAVAMKLCASHVEFVFGALPRTSRRSGVRIADSPLSESVTCRDDRAFDKAIVSASEYLRLCERMWDSHKSEDSSYCFECSKKFNITRRRHHCRMCRALVCASCSKHKAHFMRSTQEPHFTSIASSSASVAKAAPRWVADRVCDPCAEWLYRHEMQRTRVRSDIVEARLRNLIAWASKHKIPLYFLQRHGKSLANVAEEGALLSGSGFMANIQRINPKDGKFRDAALTKEAAATAKFLWTVVGKSLNDSVDSIRVSPLTRAVQTASFTFGPSSELHVYSDLSEQMKTQSDRGMENLRNTAKNPLEYRYRRCGVTNRLDLENVGDGKWWHSDGPIEWEKDVRLRIERTRASLSRARTAAARRPIAVVGHSGFFKSFLGPAFSKMKNLEIRPVVLLPDGKSFVPLGWGICTTHNSMDVYIVDAYADGHVKKLQENCRMLSQLGALVHDHVAWRWGQGLSLDEDGAVAGDGYQSNGTATKDA
eukprot:g1834.t1